MYVAAVIILLRHAHNDLFQQTLISIIKHYVPLQMSKYVATSFKIAKYVCSLFICVGTWYVILTDQIKHNIYQH